MRKYLYALLFCLSATPAWAQCNGVFPASTICGNSTATSAPPTATPSANFSSGPPGATVAIQSYLSWNPSSISAGTCSVNTININGARPDLDQAQITPPPGMPSNLMVTGLIIFPDEAQVSVCNFTSGSLSPSGGIYVVTVR